MLHRSRPVLLAFLTLAVSFSSGCGKKNSKAEGKVGACDRIKTESLCLQFGDGNFEAAGEEFLREMCTTLEGNFSLQACPAENQVGSCSNPEGTKVYYSTGGFPSTPEKAKERCTHTWAPAK